MKVYKVLLILFFITTFIILFPTLIYAHVDDKIEQIEMEVEIKEDGNAIVREKWYVNSMERFSYFKFYEGLDYTEIKNFSVTDELETKYDYLENWDISMPNEDKVNKCGINIAEDGIELCWGVRDNGFHYYILNYEICNFVKKYKDSKGIEFNFIDKRINSNSICN